MLRNFVFAVLASILILHANAAVAANGDWPSWLGPNGDGKSLDTGLLNEWPAKGPKLLWKADGIGVGFSSVAVADGKVYITGDQGGKLSILAFDLEGKPLWQKVHDMGRGGPDGSRGSPVVDDGKLYVPAYAEGYCFDVKQSG